MSRTCGICGDTVESRVPPGWHPSKRLRRAERDMQAHLRTHSFAELLRYEIRKDIDQVPDEHRPGIVRDVYRQLLGNTASGTFELYDADSRGVYSIDEALGGLGLYRLWRTAGACGLPRCDQH
ncbi:MAG: hypothetical protein JOZ81_05150 [Chloroflexi bacterium]|nr:hypothetical protein [Chloroflexota bacterium]